MGGGLLDRGLAVVAAVPRHQQADGSAGAVDHGAGIAAGVRPVVPDHLYVAPSLSAVAAAAQDQVDVAGVGAGLDSPLAKGEHRPCRRDDRGRDAQRQLQLAALAFRLFAMFGLEGDREGLPREIVCRCLTSGIQQCRRCQQQGGKTENCDSHVVPDPFPPPFRWQAKHPQAMIAGRANWGIISEPAAHFEAISGRSLGNTVPDPKMGVAGLEPATSSL